MLYNRRNDIINAFTNEYIYSENVEKHVHYEPEEPGFEGTIAERTKLKRQRYNEIVRDAKNLNKKLFKRPIKLPSPILTLNILDNTDNKKRNNKVVYTIISGFSDLKDKTEKMFEDGKKIKQQHRVVDVAEKVLDFSNQKKDNELKY